MNGGPGELHMTTDTIVAKRYLHRNLCPCRSLCCTERNKTPCQQPSISSDQTAKPIDNCLRVSEKRTEDLRPPNYVQCRVRKCVLVMAYRISIESLEWMRWFEVVVKERSLSSDGTSGNTITWLRFVVAYRKNSRHGGHQVPSLN